MRRSAILHTRLYREWDTLRETYKQAVPHLTSPGEWKKTFDISEGKAPSKE